MLIPFTDYGVFVERPAPWLGQREGRNRYRSPPSSRGPRMSSRGHDALDAPSAPSFAACHRAMPGPSIRERCAWRYGSTGRCEIVTRSRGPPWLAWELWCALALCIVCAKSCPSQTRGDCPRSRATLSRCPHMTIAVSGCRGWDGRGPLDLPRAPRRSSREGGQGVARGKSLEEHANFRAELRSGCE